MYMLLTIYAVTNLNDVSWGTRESETAEKAETELDRQAKKGTRTCFFCHFGLTSLNSYMHFPHSRTHLFHLELTYESITIE